MRTKNFKAKSVAELQHQLDAVIKNDFTPTLGILFCSLTHDLKQIQLAFDAANIDLVGCSSSGEIMDDRTFDTSIVYALVDIPKDYYRVISRDTSKSIFSAAYEIGEAAVSSFNHPAIIVVSGGISGDAEKIILGFQLSIDKDIPIFGGLAGDDLQWNNTFALSRHHVTKNGLSALILDTDKVEVKGLATSGWEAIGSEHVITEAYDNIVYTINEEPALDVFIKYFGYFDNAELEGQLINTMSAQYPLQIIREGGYNVLRSPLFSTEDKSLIFAGGIKEGDKFRFSISPGFDVIDKTINEFEDLKNNVPEADLLIMFSCKGRHAALGPLIEDEIAGIHHKWNAPLIGLFTYGEIGNVKNGTCDFHNETCATVILKEKVA